MFKTYIKKKKKKNGKSCEHNTNNMKNEFKVHSLPQ
jgi:hypothetical protein